MRSYNTIIILNPKKDRILFCKRMNDPYEGLFNFVGGKIEPGETSEEAAYRELEEETGISREDVKLYYFMDFCWHLQDMRMEVYAGVLRHEVILKPEKHPLHWLGFEQNYFDMRKFAGEGNLGHMLEILKMSKEIFGPVPLTREELIHKGCICFDNIEEGFRNYEWEYLEGSGEDLHQFLRRKISENGMENCYLDFYYGSLKQEEKERIQSFLKPKEKDYLERLCLKEDQIYFAMTEELFELAFGLSESEELFSTFYFGKDPCTIWSNYGHKFVVFNGKRSE